jgi:hypothetical protein
MTLFLDARLSATGGDRAASVAVNQGTDINNYQSMTAAQLHSAIQGRHVLIAAHGFHVDRANGISHLSNWEGLLQIPSPFVFVGLLWPGDSVWAHGLDYPAEPRIANETGQLVAPFIDANFAGAASVSFASHSLGARVVLETIALMNLPVRRLTLMAPAIDDDCLNTEFSATVAKVGEISVLASKKDEVLSAIFPLGNFFAGILTQGHPWWHAALGHRGPANPPPGNLHAPFQIPDNWGFGHGDYLRWDSAPAPVIAVPVDVPPNGSALPAGGSPAWQEAWSAAFASTRFR